MADAFRAFAIGQFTVQFDSLLLGEILLLEFKLGGEVEQSQFLFLFGDHFIQKGQVIAEEDDGGGIVDVGVFAYVALEEDRRHGRDVLVAEAQIGAGEAGVAGLDAATPASSTAAAEFRSARRATTPVPTWSVSVGRIMWRAKIFSATVIGRRSSAPLIGGRNTLPCMRATLNGNKPPYSITWRVISSSPAVNSLRAISSPFRMRSIREKLVEVSSAQVLAILLVNALDVFRDHYADAGAHLRVGRLFPARSLPTAFAAHRADEAAALHVSSPDRSPAAAFQSQIWNFAKCLVKVEAVMRGRNFVGRNVVAQFGIVRGILAIPGQIFAGQLPPDQFGIFGEKENASLQPNLIRTFFDFAFEQ